MELPKPHSLCACVFGNLLSSFLTPFFSLVCWWCSEWMSFLLFCVVLFCSNQVKININKLNFEVRLYLKVALVVVFSSWCGLFCVVGIDVTGLCGITFCNRLFENRLLFLKKHSPSHFKPKALLRHFNSFFFQHLAISLFASQLNQKLNYFFMETSFT